MLCCARLLFQEQPEALSTGIFDEIDPDNGSVDLHGSDHRLRHQETDPVNLVVLVIVPWFIQNQAQLGPASPTGVKGDPYLLACRILLGNELPESICCGFCHFYHDIPLFRDPFRSIFPVSPRTVPAPFPQYRVEARDRDRFCSSRAC